MEAVLSRRHPGDRFRFSILDRKSEPLDRPSLCCLAQDGGPGSFIDGITFLDQLGQVRAVDWPGKTPDLQAGRRALTEAFAQAREQATEKRMSKYGGWIDGPKLKATGRFRTEKVGGQWWLVDPEGHLSFFRGSLPDRLAGGNLRGKQTGRQ